ncbi:MAG: helix-turn-helix transcriptional regulator [Hydrococcus sp. CRU_1_1]|nr:helix-turn-helix transcriptional regulator [Hydrococcus sp. CRU_1_1]
MRSLVVDFAKEKEKGYQRIFSRSPLLSSASAQWKDILVAYDYFVPGQTPDTCIKQHGIGIFVDVPTPVQTERAIDGKFRREQVSQGDIIIVPANTWHRAGWDLAGGAIIVGLQPQEFLRTIDETIDRDRVELIPYFATPDPLVHQIGLALKQTLENPGKVGRLYAQTMTTTLMVHLLQHYCAQQLVLPTYSGGLSRLKLQRVIDYINAHLDRDLSLHELAAIVQISSHYFVQLFKQSTGITPHQYVIQCRIERAKQLLMKRGAIVADVARIVGFVDQSHFHRHFKRLVGITPKTFLRQINS